MRFLNVFVNVPGSSLTIIDGVNEVSRANSVSSSKDPRVFLGLHGVKVDVDSAILIGKFFVPPLIALAPKRCDKVVALKAKLVVRWLVIRGLD